MVILSEFRMGQYRDNDHREDALDFILVRDNLFYNLRTFGFCGGGCGGDFGSEGTSALISSFLIGFVSGTSSFFISFLYFFFFFNFCQRLSVCVGYYYVGKNQKHARHNVLEPFLIGLI